MSEISMNPITQAVILCGGFGTRLGELVKDTPKPMLEVGGKPILEHNVECLKKYGITEIIFCAYYKADVIEKHFTNLDLGVNVSVSIEETPLGTAGPLNLIKDQLDKNFLIIYGDEFIDFDMGAFMKTHFDKEAIITVLARPSTHPWSADLIQTDKEDRITEFISKNNLRAKLHNLGSAALYVANKRVLEYIPEEKKQFAEEVFPAMITAGEKLVVHKMRSNDFVKDMGKPERFAIVERYLENRAKKQEALKNSGPITTVFLDRDGVLNKEVDLLDNVDNLQVLNGVPEAIKLFKDNNILTVMVSNQPVIARGLATEETVDAINTKLQEEIGELDAIYLCPHHPETQYGEGVQALRMDCECRKPKPGMIFQAAREHNIDLSGAVMIGDSFCDLEAGKNAGLRTIFIDSGNGVVKENMQPDFTFNSLLEVAKKISGGKL